MPKERKEMKRKVVTGLMLTLLVLGTLAFASNIHRVEPTAIHDICIWEVTPSKTLVAQGYSLSINVTVENEGDFTETFNITVYYDIESERVTIETKTVINLPSGEETVVPFTWNTTGVARGNYTLSAVADTVI